ncbi:MAG: hypothetical protein ACRDGN_18445 [bacterium]
MDLVAEYAHAYGGVPPLDRPWHELYALAVRTDRFDARDRLRLAEGAMLGRPPVDEGDIGQRMLRIAELQQRADPTLRS